MIDSRNAFVMYNMMQDVIRGGTGARAMALGRIDLAGKTGTTNDQMDAWFAGFQRHLTTRGVDRLRSAALAGAERDRRGGRPADLDLLHGRRAQGPARRVPGDARGRPRGPHQSRHRACAIRKAKTGIVEYFYQENLPPEGEPAPETGAAAPRRRKPEDVKSDL